MRNLRIFLFLLPILSFGLAREPVFPTRECLSQHITTVPACVEYHHRQEALAKSCRGIQTSAERRTCKGQRRFLMENIKRRLDGIEENAYKTYEDMVKYIELIQTVKHPKTRKPLVQVENIGKTSERRDMHLVKISSDHSADKPVVFFEAGMHAREWTAPAAAFYMISQLVQNYTATHEALEHIDYYIIPLSNPDGYEYSRKKDRYWRKTRSQRGKHYGVDGNRNFKVHWAEVEEQKNNSEPSSEIYKGPYPFSEPETRNIRNAGQKYKNRIKAFISIHAFGALIGYGWGYTKDIAAPLEKQMKMVAMEAANAIKKYSGTVYSYGSSSKLIYPSAGGSDDYFKEVLGVGLSFTFELSSSGEHDFLVSQKKLLKITSEAFEGFKAIAAYAEKFDAQKSCFRVRKAPYKDLIC